LTSYAVFIFMLYNYRYVILANKHDADDDFQHVSRSKLFS